MNRASVRSTIVGLMFLAALSAAKTQTERVILVYFDNPSLELKAQSSGDSTAFPFQEYPAVRVVMSEHPERQSVLELLRGPTRTEISGGYTTNLEGLRLSKFVLSHGRALVWLKGKLLLKGTLSAPRLRKQVERTIRQFKRVRAVTLYINGKENFGSLK